MGVDYYADTQADPNWKHPVDEIEPEESEHDERAEVLLRLIDFLWPKDSNDLLAAGRKFAILGVLLGKSDLNLTAAAVALGFSPAAASKIAVSLSKQLGGLRQGGMHRDEARSNKAVARRRYLEKGAAIARGEENQNEYSRRHRDWLKRAAYEWRTRYLGDELRQNPTTSSERRAMRELGFFEGESDNLTEAGKRWVIQVL